MRSDRHNPWNKEGITETGERSTRTGDREVIPSLLYAESVWITLAQARRIYRETRPALICIKEVCYKRFCRKGDVRRKQTPRVQKHRKARQEKTLSMEAAAPHATTGHPATKASTRYSPEDGRRSESPRDEPPTLSIRCLQNTRTAPRPDYRIQTTAREIVRRKQTLMPENLLEGGIGGF